MPRVVLACALWTACGGPAEPAAQGPAPAVTEAPATGGEATGGDDLDRLEARTRGLFVGSDRGQSAERSDRLLSFRVLRTVDGRESVLAPGTVLSSCDSFHLKVEALASTYVLLAYVDPEERFSRLYPTPGEPPLTMAAGDSLRVPPEGQEVRLDDCHEGVEQLYVFASAGPLSASDAQLEDLIRRSEASGRVPAEQRADRQRRAEAAVTSPDPSAPSGGADTFTPTYRTRGLGVVSTEGSVEVAPDAAGVAVMVFPLGHRRLSAGPPQACPGSGAPRSEP
ncbi:MAG: DUF4384 domain-containing protein [Sandaracinaceae bacterium]